MAGPHHLPSRLCGHAPIILPGKLNPFHVFTCAAIPRPGVHGIVRCRVAIISYPVAAYRCSLMAASTTMRASPVDRGILQRCDATGYQRLTSPYGTTLPPPLGERLVLLPHWECSL